MIMSLKISSDFHESRGKLERERERDKEDLFIKPASIDDSLPARTQM
jgi:hypothetical protein